MHVARFLVFVAGVSCKTTIFSTTNLPGLLRLFVVTETSTSSAIGLTRVCNAQSVRAAALQPTEVCLLHPHSPTHLCRARRNHCCSGALRGSAAAYSPSSLLHWGGPIHQRPTLHLFPWALASSPRFRLIY